MPFPLEQLFSTMSPAPMTARVLQVSDPTQVINRPVRHLIGEKPSVAVVITPTRPKTGEESGALSFFGIVHFDRVAKFEWATTSHLSPCLRKTVSLGACLSTVFPPIVS